MGEGPHHRRTPALGAYHPDPTVEQWTAHGRPALENFDYQVHGYQALGVLLRTGTYSAAFLDTVGGDMLAADRAGNGVDAWPHQAWDHTGVALVPGGDADTWDPVVGLLTALGHDTHTAQAFLTAETTGEKGTGSERLTRVDHLVTDRNWGTDDTGVNALGTALRTATATTEPAALRIVESIVREVSLDENTSQDTFANSQILPPALRPHLGHVLARHINSVINGIGEVDPRDYSEPKAALDRYETAGLLAELGKDPTARATLLNATYDHSLTLYENACKNKQGHDLVSSLSYYSRAVANVAGALDHGATIEEGRRLTEQDEARNGTVDMIHDWATAALNTGVAAGGISGPLPGAATEAVLQSVIIHHMPTTDLVNSGIIDPETGLIRPRSDWPDDAQTRWKDSVLHLENGHDLTDVYNAISGHYEDGRGMLWMDRKSK